MVQIWILNRNENPVEAVKTGLDKLVCGDCPLRGTTKRACYVRVGDAPLAIWKAYSRGHYELLTADQYEEAFSGRFVRFGAYGEPTLIPFRMLEAIAKTAAGFTGYTHQWRNPIFGAFKHYLMASTSSSDYREAIALGWRTFTVSSHTITGLMVCPASHEFEQARGCKLSCIECRRCAGLTVNARSVQIEPHGQGAKYVNNAAAAA